MIPPFEKSGLLPPGIHRATWDQFVDRFACNRHRRRLVNGLRQAADDLQIAGCTRLYINGSFVTAKPRPSDFDACWDPRGVDPYLLDPVLLDLRPPRAAQKAKYGGELCPASALAAPGFSYLEFFQRDRNGIQKGIVAIDLTAIRSRGAGRNVVGGSR